MRRILAVMLSLSLITGAVSVAATGAQPGISLASGGEHGDIQLPENETTDANASMGSQISTFMQSSAADANGSVESGMWSAAYNGSTTNQTKVALVEKRTKTLEKRLEQLEKKKQRLQQRKDEMNPVAYQAQLASITSQLAAISDAIDETETRATEVGVDTAKLEELRTNASEMAGPEVAAMARQLAGNTPDDIPGLGPDKQGTDNETDGNGNGGPPGENPGNSNKNTTDNETDGQGPPSDPGNGGGKGGKGGNGGSGGTNDVTIADRIAARR